MKFDNEPPKDIMIIIFLFLNRFRLFTNFMKCNVKNNCRNDFGALLPELLYDLKWLIRRFQKSYKKILVAFIKHRVSK